MFTVSTTRKLKDSERAAIARFVSRDLSSVGLRGSEVAFNVDDFETVDGPDEIAGAEILAHVRSVVSGEIDVAPAGELGDDVATLGSLDSRDDVQREIDARNDRIRIAKERRDFFQHEAEKLIGTDIYRFCSRHDCSLEDAGVHMSQEARVAWTQARVYDSELSQLGYYDE